MTTEESDIPRETRFGLAGSTVTVETAASSSNKREQKDLLRLAENSKFFKLTVVAVDDNLKEVNDDQ